MITSKHAAYVNLIKYLTGLDLTASKSTQQVVAAQNEFIQKIHGQTKKELDEIIGDYEDLSLIDIDIFNNLKNEDVVIDDFVSRKENILIGLSAYKNRIIFKEVTKDAIDDLINYLTQLNSNTINKTEIDNWDLVLEEKKKFIEMLQRSGLSTVTGFINYYKNNLNKPQGNNLLETGFGEMRVELITSFHKAHREIYKKYQGIETNGEWGGTFNNKYDGMHFGLKTSFIRSLTNE